MPVRGSPMRDAKGHVAGGGSHKMFRTAWVSVVVAAALAVTGCVSIEKPIEPNIRPAAEGYPTVEPVEVAEPVPTPPLPQRKPESGLAWAPPLASAEVDRNIGMLIGLDLTETQALLGPPSLEEVNPPARLWSYTGYDCVLVIFFYPQVEDQSYRALTYEVRGDEANQEAPELCFSELLAQQDPLRG